MQHPSGSQTAHVRRTDDPTDTPHMTYGDFQQDRKYCPHCQAYVAYLASPSLSYCAQCGGEVRLMSPADWETFNHERTSRPRPTRKRSAAAKKRKRSAV